MSNARLERRIVKAQEYLHHVENKALSNGFTENEDGLSAIHDAVYRLNHLLFQKEQKVHQILGGK